MKAFATRSLYTTDHGGEIPVVLSSWAGSLAALLLLFDTAAFYRSSVAHHRVTPLRPRVLCDTRQRETHCRRTTPLRLAQANSSTRKRLVLEDVVGLFGFRDPFYSPK